jgi:hypothetical protein
MLHFTKGTAVIFCLILLGAAPLSAQILSESSHLTETEQSKEVVAPSGKQNTDTPAAEGDAGERSPAGATLEHPHRTIATVSTLFQPKILGPVKRLAAEDQMATGAEEDVTLGHDWDPKELRKATNNLVRFPRRVNPTLEQVAAEDADDASSAALSQRFHWKPAVYQSFIAQGFQHAYALVIQEKTRRALKGPFFSDYWESIKGVRGWDDGNKFFTNYIAHPMQGGMTGFIFIQNHDRARSQKFNESKQYWKDRLKALVWSAAWSTNWEIGPISQASIGNVGLYGHGGYVDFVMTPTAGTAWTVTEEALDRYFIRHVEDKSLTVRIIVRTIFNPTRSVANLLRFKKPWYRDRPLGD